MPHILDRVARTTSHFRPHTVTEFFALQLARKLGDLERLQTYVILVERHSEDTLLQAFKRAVNHHHKGLRLSERFQAELERLSHKEDHERSQTSRD
jgi:hypothetical protein